MRAKTILAKRSRVAARLAILLAAALLTVSSGTPANAATRVTGSALELLAQLTTASEHSSGYERKLFVHWIDADGDGCTTRNEVLIEESRTTAQVGDGCSVAGSWRSAYDGVTTTDPGSFDIDHMVPLKETWESGAWGWTKARRQDYANDLGDWRSLRAVTASSNRSKGDKDPAQWLPPRIGFRCLYATHWVAVKFRWSLRVDSAERAALRTLLGICPTRTVRVTVVPLTTPTPTPTPTPVPPPPPTPTPMGTPLPTPATSPTPTPSPTP
jgi:hypothetical protein